MLGEHCGVSSGPGQGGNKVGEVDGLDKKHMLSVDGLTCLPPLLRASPSAVRWLQDEAGPRDSPETLGHPGPWLTARHLASAGLLESAP